MWNVTKGEAKTPKLPVENDGVYARPGGIPWDKVLKKEGDFLRFIW